MCSQQKLDSVKKSWQIIITKCVRVYELEKENVETFAIFYFV